MQTLNSTPSLLLSRAQSPDLSNRLSVDVNSLDALKLQAKRDEKGAMKGVAQQFESMFLQMMLKTMRSASMGDEGDPFGSRETKMFTGLLDDQYATQMSGKGGIGLADMIMKQLSRDHVYSPAQLPLEARQPKVAPLPGTTRPDPMAAPLTKTAMQQFVDKLVSHAKPAAEQLGVAPHLLASHAALETGWGKRMIRDANGQDSHNLFGIKAGKSWQGPVAEVTTTEYVNGQPEKRVERFRVYSSYQAAFEDYAQLLQKNDRYKDVLNQGQDAAGFAQALQQGGYATDPQYANKLTKVAGHQIMRRAALAAYQQWA
ncbi:flagellar protein FlgJ [Chitinivorax tropicus]|uniref:Peptidoglycan hydrolase FlgJ n=1 Tax=Chitinivorax tropicus TaxID=714531 RepID=A0A840MP07_9PROT|nr:flagellar assembly peptidoglycan hydrolase FlgJ [Chitinivorax tropicus]MBB5018737.1 flagellar protein FlgJ [Chitinivorax tropicus]